VAERAIRTKGADDNESRQTRPSVRSRLLAAGLKQTAQRVADRDGRRALARLARTRWVADRIGSLAVRATVSTCSMGPIPAEVVRAPSTDPSRAVHVQTRHRHQEFLAFC
jgi:hypothetical protein